MSSTDLEGSGNGGGDLVELFPGVVPGRSEGREQVVQAQQGQQQQGGPESLQQVARGPVVGQVTRAGPQLHQQHSHDVAEEDEVERHRQTDQHNQYIRVRAFIDPASGREKTMRWWSL